MTDAPGAPRTTPPPGPKRWLLLAAGLTSLGLSTCWGLLASPSHSPDFTVYHLPMKVLFPLGCVALVSASLWAFFRLFPEALPEPELSLASLPGALAATLVLLAGFAASVGLARGVNELLARTPVERRQGTLSSLGVDNRDQQVAIIRLSDFETLELGLPRLRALGLTVGSPVAVEFHHGPLFSWGWAHGTGEPSLLEDGP